MNVTALNRDILSAAIQRTDEQYGTHQYALLTPLGCFQIGCKEDAGNYIGVSTPLPILLPSRAVLELIRYYDDSFSERHRLKKRAPNRHGAGWYGLYGMVFEEALLEVMHRTVCMIKLRTTGFWQRGNQI